MAGIRVLSGAGRYADPWHRFGESSAAAAAILRDAGHRVRIVETTAPDCLAGLAAVDLVVVNSGAGLDTSAAGIPAYAPDWGRAHRDFGAWLDAGGRCLVLHTGINTFRDWADWPRRVGGTWTAGVSGHPLRSIATFEAHPEALGHPILGGLSEVTCYDERYWRMGIDPASMRYLRHETNEEWWDVCWVSPSGIVYDALGHDGRSYAAASRAHLLTAEVAWLVD